MKLTLFGISMYGQHAIKLIVLFMVLLSLPMIIVVARNGSVFDVPLMVVSTLGFAVLLFAVTTLLARGSAALAVVVTSLLLLCALLTRCLYWLVYDFSGRGFGSEFFLHINRTSLIIGLDEYGPEIIVVLLLWVLATVVAVLLARRHEPAPARVSVFGLVASIALIYIGAAASPELRLAQASWQYYGTGGAPKVEAGQSREHARRELEFLRHSDSLPVDKRRVRARPPEQPHNLILVYLESFNLMLTELPEHPGLTPRIDRLKERFHSFSNIRASGYFTMEGIANSQCGTLMNMEKANNSLLTRRGRLPSLPCLGDVLQAAGYEQVYLGGAPLDFAGKGEFFRDHGYDEVIGWEYWDAKGHEPINGWGLSDAVLFDKAFDYIRNLREGPDPFHVTVLTLGTHLPGVRYEECPEYTNGDGSQFLNAVHCTDYLLGEFVDRLAAAGILEDTVLYIQADHGVFNNHEMKNLFGDKVTDRRLVTLLSLPEQLEDAFGTRLHKDALGSSLDTVATLIDLLELDTNTEFILARSLVDGGPHPAYHITRRDDYYDGNVVSNTPAACDGADEPKKSLPLDQCGKKRVLDAVSSLNLTYTDHDPAATEVCELSAEVHIDPGNGQFRIRWGNQMLSDRFYHRGVPVRGGKEKGVYAVLLDRNDNLINTLFFRIDNEIDLDNLDHIMQSARDGERILLIRDADVAGVDKNLRGLLPGQLKDHTLIYGSFEGANLNAGLQYESKKLAVELIPGSCAGGARELATGTESQ